MTINEATRQVDALNQTQEAVIAAAEFPSPRGVANEPAAGDDEPANERERELVAIWKDALGRPQVGVNDSFGALGGDSLSSVGAVLEMKRLGVPDEIARGLYRGLTIRQMVRMETAGAAGSAVSATKIELSSIEMPIFLRAVAIYLVVASHLGLSSLGGNWTLMIVSGLNFAKFQLQSVDKEESIRPIIRLMLKLAIPCFLWMFFSQMWDVVVHGARVDILSWFFFDNLRDPEPFKGGQSPWFIDLLLQCWMIMAILLSVRRVRQFAVRRTYEFGLIFLATAWAISVIVRLLIDPRGIWSDVPNMYLWLMALGWCAAYSRTDREKTLTSVALLALNAINVYFGVGQILRWHTVVAALALIWLEEIPARVPRVLAQVAIGMAGASLFIYLTHPSFDHALRIAWPGRPALVGVAWTMLAGFVVWKLWNQTTRLALECFRRLGFGGADLRVRAIDG